MTTRRRPPAASAARFAALSAARMLAPATLWLLVAVPCLLAAAPAFAASYVIRPDGGGDFPTIQAGIDGSMSGDTLLLTDGTFTGPGNRDLQMANHSALIRSQSGDATRCAIDLEGERLGTNGNSSTEFRNIDIRNGRELSGYFVTTRFVGCLFTNPIRIGSAQESLLELIDCTVTGGASGAYYLGGGETVHLVRCRMIGNAGAGLFAGFNLTAQDCLFENNVSTGTVLGVSPWMGMAASLHATRCRFAGNVAPEGMLSSASGYVTAEACTFSENTGTSLQVTADDFGHDLTIQITQCTMSDNHGGSEILLLPSPFARSVLSLYFDHSILAFREPGCAVACSSVVPVMSISCCDIFANAGGDWTGCIAGLDGIDGNISEDPLFCGGDAGYQLRSDSPCAPGGACPASIGANPVGCIPPASAPDAAGPGTPFGAPFVVAQPNPGVDRVTFHGDAAAGAWTLDLFDATGRRVRSLTAGAGLGTDLIWDGRDAGGSPLPAGLYLYLARSTGREQRGSLVLAR
jgi:hypothetical protein